MFVLLDTIGPRGYKPRGFTPGLHAAEARRSLVLDLRVAGDDAFRHLPKPREVRPDELAAPLKVGEGFDADVAEQFSVAAVELLMHPRWRIGGEHLLAPGIGHDHPEHGLAVEPALDQLAAAVDRNRAGRVADV